MIYIDNYCCTGYFHALDYQEYCKSMSEDAPPEQQIMMAEPPGLSLCRVFC